ncbi:uncharacterized protein V6R79_016247 [Siganus canaliculatus]
MKALNLQQRSAFAGHFQLAGSFHTKAAGFELAEDGVSPSPRLGTSELISLNSGRSPAECRVIPYLNTTRARTQQPREHFSSELRCFLALTQRRQDGEDVWRKVQGVAVLTENGKEQVQRAGKCQDELRNNSQDFFTPEIHDEVKERCRKEKTQRVKEGENLRLLSSPLL